jgi:hypothetical protein
VRNAFHLWHKIGYNALFAEKTKGYSNFVILTYLTPSIALQAVYNDKYRVKGKKKKYLCSSNFKFINITGIANANTAKLLTRHVPVNHNTDSIKTQIDRYREEL